MHYIRGNYYGSNLFNLQATADMIAYTQYLNTIQTGKFYNYV